MYYGLFYLFARNIFFFIFGKVMIYVNNPKAAADFWTDKIGFTVDKINDSETGIISVELTPNSTSDAGIVLFDRDIVRKMEHELNLGTPSILFSSYNIKDMRDKLIEKGVNVGDIIEMNGALTFNFSDPEGNYFAVEQIEKS